MRNIFRQRQVDEKFKTLNSNFGIPILIATIIIILIIFIP